MGREYQILSALGKRYVAIGKEEKKKKKVEKGGKVGNGKLAPFPPFEVGGTFSRKRGKEEKFHSWKRGEKVVGTDVEKTKVSLRRLIFLWKSQSRNFSLLFLPSSSTFPRN